MNSSYLLLTLYLVFATITLLCYRLTSKKYRYIVLLVFSLISFCIYSKFLTVFLVLSIISVFYAGLWIKKVEDKFITKLELAKDLPKEERKNIKKQKERNKKLIVSFVIIFNIAILAILKYSPFFASIFEGIFSWFNISIVLPVIKIGMPIGISYYTLCAIGYLIDVSRGKYDPEKNIFKFATFVSYYPQAFMGPITRYGEMKTQFENGGDENTSKCIMQGYALIVWGFLKKFVFADRMAILVSSVFGSPSNYSGGIIILGIVFFTFQLYIEFSAYINMAEGISYLFGIRLPKNFEQPFFSQTVPEFWRRWHISLGAWCREYIFYSVSMSKGMTKLNKKIHGKTNSFFETFIPSAISLLAVWLAMGIWHGASWSYIIYGLYYYFLTIVGMCFEPLNTKLYQKFKLKENNKLFIVLRIVRTFILINIGMLIFRANGIGTAAYMFKRIFTATSGRRLFKIIALKDFVICLIGIVITIVVDIIYKLKIDLLDKFSNLKFYVKYMIILVVIFTIIVFGAYGQGYTVIDPLYGGF